MFSNSHLDKHTLLGTENSTIEVLDRDDIVRTARQNTANNMAASNDQLIAATPILMGIPPESTSLNYTGTPYPTSAFTQSQA